VIASAPRNPQHRGVVTAWDNVYQSNIVTVVTGEEVCVFVG